MSRRVLFIVMWVLCGAIILVGYIQNEFEHADWARQSRAVTAMAESWNGEIGFEPTYAALEPAAEAPAEDEDETQASPAHAVFDANDEYWGLPRNPGYETVAAYCSACHSLQLVMQQNRNARRWDELIEWMITTQNMARPPEEDRQAMVDYLARNFGDGSN
jgi:cytochrome c1